MVFMLFSIILLSDLGSAVNPPPPRYDQLFVECKNNPELELSGAEIDIPFGEPQIHSLTDEDVFRILEYPPNPMAQEFVVRVDPMIPGIHVGRKFIDITVRKITDSKALLDIEVNIFVDPVNDYVYYGFQNSRNRFHTLLDAVKFYQMNELNIMKENTNANIILGPLVPTSKIMKHYATNHHSHISNHFRFRLSKSHYWDKQMVPTGFATRVQCFIFPDNYDDSWTPYEMGSQWLEGYVLLLQSIGSFILNYRRPRASTIYMVQHRGINTVAATDDREQHYSIEIRNSRLRRQYIPDGTESYSVYPEDPAKPAGPYFKTLVEYVDYKLSLDKRAFLVPKVEAFYLMKRYEEIDSREVYSNVFVLPDGRPKGVARLHDWNSEAATHHLVGEEHGTFLYRTSTDPDVHFALSFVMKPGLQTLKPDVDGNFNVKEHPDVQVFHIKVYKCKPKTGSQSLEDSSVLTIDEDEHDIQSLAQLTTALTHEDRHVFVLNDKLEDLKIPVKLTRFIEPSKGAELESKNCNHGARTHQSLSDLPKEIKYELHRSHSSTKLRPQTERFNPELHPHNPIDHTPKPEIQTITSHQAEDVLKKMGKFHYLFREATVADQFINENWQIHSVIEKYGLRRLKINICKCPISTSLIGKMKKLFSNDAKHELVFYGCDNAIKEERFKSFEDIQKFFLHKKVPPASSDYERYLILTTPWLKKIYPKPYDRSVSFKYVSKKQALDNLATSTNF